MGKDGFQPMAIFRYSFPLRPSLFIVPPTAFHGRLCLATTFPQIVWIFSPTPTRRPTQPIIVSVTDAWIRSGSMAQDYARYPHCRHPGCWDCTRGGCDWGHTRIHSNP